MLEQDIKSLYERLASMDQPPSRISIPGAGRAGRVRRARRRAAAVAAPVLAAAAVTAIGLAASVQGSGGGPAAQLAASRQPAPQHFSPLRPYARFGWLPPGTNTGPAAGDEVISQRAMSLGDTSGAFLALYAAGACHLAGHTLRCAEAGPERLGASIAQADGHPAYWTAPSKVKTPLGPSIAPGVLAWQYAVGGWAVLDYVPSGHASALSNAVRIAEHVQFGYQGEPAIRFPVQLTDVPANWQVNCVATSVIGHVMYAESDVVTAGRDSGSECGDDQPVNAPHFDAGPGERGECAGLMVEAKPHPEVINGYYVFLGSEKDWPNQELCANNAAGTFVWIALGAHPALSPASIFAHHLRLLGPDPAKWTTKPIA